MNAQPTGDGTQAHPENAGATDTAKQSVLERMLRTDETKVEGAMHQTRLASWEDGQGLTEQGATVRKAASCLLDPEAGDTIVVWRNASGEAWALNVLMRAHASAPAMLSAGESVAIAADQITIKGKSVHVHAEEVLENVTTKHAVFARHSETCQLRVADVGTDVRRAGHVNDIVRGSLMQKATNWIAHTVRDVRMHARAMMVD